MKKCDRLVHVTEQKLLGWRVIFDDRWDHHIALKALGSDRAAFDDWAVAVLAQLESHYRPIPRLVIWFLWDRWNDYAPVICNDGVLRAFVPRHRTYAPPTRWSPEWEGENRAHQLHVRLQMERLKRRSQRAGPPSSAGFGNSVLQNDMTPETTEGALDRAMAQSSYGFPSMDDEARDFYNAYFACLEKQSFVSVGRKNEHAPETTEATRTELEGPVVGPESTLGYALL